MEGQTDYVTFPWENCPGADFIQPGASQNQMVSQMNLAGAFMLLLFFHHEPAIKISGRPNSSLCFTQGDASGREHAGGQFSTFYLA